MPVFAAIAETLPDKRLVKPLALLFPTVILLSAGGSLIGAGAHLLAAQSIRQTTGLHLGYLDGPPFSLLTAIAVSIHGPVHATVQAGLGPPACREIQIDPRLDQACRDQATGFPGLKPVADLSDDAAAMAGYWRVVRWISPSVPLPN